MHVALVALLSALGAAFKITGGLLYGSAALYIDGLTCAANMAALAGVIYYAKASRLPPDLDHHYGHKRLSYGGVLVVLIAYSFVAGVSVMRLADTSPYSVDLRAALFAAIGLGFYGGSVVLSRREGGALSSYAVFTVSELIEGLVVIAAALAGALYSYLIDYAGGLIVLAFLLYELCAVSRDFVRGVSDVSPPERYVSELRLRIERLGVRVRRLRLREFGGTVMGDAVVVARRGINLCEAHELASRIEEEARRMGCELVVHVEPEEQ